MTHHASGGAPDRAAAIRATIVVPLHNHQAYIGQLLESMFAQWRPDLELLLIDDASTDAGYAVVQDILERHADISVTLLRTNQSIGMGLPKEILRLAKGAIIIRADSDDIALPGRFDALLDCFDSDPDCRLVTSNAVLLSPEGVGFGVYTNKHADTILSDPVAAASVEFDSRWLGATIAYHRDVYDRFPPIDPELCAHGLDLILPLRAVLLGTHHYLMQPFVAYRQHTANTHRVLGARGGSLALQEQYQANVLMIFRQKIRDVEFFRNDQSSELMDSVLYRCWLNFRTRFDDWSRLRIQSASKAQVETVPSKMAAAYMPGIAPIPTLDLDQPLSFGPGGFGAQCLLDVSGFHAPEHWGGLWTEAAVQFNIRIKHSLVERPFLEFELMIHDLVPTQRVAIILDGQNCAKSQWDGPQRPRILIPITRREARSVVSIVILAPDATIPGRVDSRHRDERLIGIGLVSVTLRGKPKEPA